MLLCQSRYAATLAVGCFALAGCTTEFELEKVVSPAIYGDDDRQEVLEYPHLATQERGLGAVAALVASSGSMERWSGWSYCDPANLLPSQARSISEVQGLCADQRFAEQPYASTCSSTLIAPDVVLSAAHCVSDADACATTRFIFGYVWEAGAVRARSENDVYSCRELIFSPPDMDVVFVRLDRPVSDAQQPVSVGTMPEVDAPLTVIGFPTGTPMKVADGCVALEIEPKSGRIATNCDSMNGNSGSGVFDQKGQLVGVYSRGPGSYRDDPPRDCKVYTVYDESGALPGVTDVPQLAKLESAPRALEEFCSTDPTLSPYLCGGTDRCGDGLCTGSESYEICSSDCSPPSCGNGVCEFGEVGSCDADCSAAEGPLCNSNMDDNGCAVATFSKRRTGYAWGIIVAFLFWRSRRKRTRSRYGRADREHVIRCHHG